MDTILIENLIKLGMAVLVVDALEVVRVDDEDDVVRIAVAIFLDPAHRRAERRRPLLQR